MQEMLEVEGRRTKLQRPSRTVKRSLLFLAAVDEPTLREYIRKQVEYYFSEENLQRDFFLRRKMDREGYLPVSLIAGFHRIQALTQDINLFISVSSQNGFRVARFGSGRILSAIMYQSRQPQCVASA